MSVGGDESEIPPFGGALIWPGGASEDGACPAARLEPPLWPATSAPTCPHVHGAGPWGAANMGSPGPREEAVGRPTAGPQTGRRRLPPAARTSVNPPSRSQVLADPTAPRASAADTESVTWDVGM